MTPARTEPKSTPVGDPSTPPRRVGDRLVDAVAGPMTGAVTGLGSALRGARLFHPRGRAFRATLRVDGDPAFAPSLFGAPGEYEALARFSRGAGVPEPWPDMLGMAVRVFCEQGAQDLLLLSSLPAVGVRNLIVLRPGYGSTFYSSVDRLGLGDRVVVLAARAERTDGRPAPPLTRLSELAAARADLRFAYSAATPLGEWSGTVASLTLGEEMPRTESDALRFSPFHRGGGVEPVGAVNTLRRLGYAGSQGGRPH